MRSGYESMGGRIAVAAEPDTPLLYVLSGDLHLQGPRFGCGLAQCGSCSVLVNGAETRSCVTPVSAVARQIRHHARRFAGMVREAKKARESACSAPRATSHHRRTGGAVRLLLQRHDHQAAELLSKTPQPTEAQIRTAMNGHLCRCGTYPRIIKAIQRASKAIHASLDCRGRCGGGAMKSLQLRDPGSTVASF